VSLVRTGRTCVCGRLRFLTPFPFGLRGSGLSKGRIIPIR
jgi:hypothetical protein